MGWFYLVWFLSTWIGLESYWLQIIQFLCSNFKIIFVLSIFGNFVTSKVFTTSFMLCYATEIPCRRYLTSIWQINQGSREPGYKDVHWQETRNGGSVGGPADHIWSLSAIGDRLQGWWADTNPVVASDGGRCAFVGNVKRDFGRSKGLEVTRIRQAWKEGGVDGIG